MRLESYSHATERVNLTETREFKIASSAHGFRILIDKLYADKISAPIRELMTNAYDSHVEAGCADKPFEITLPNAFEPNFKVRDFGVGMSDDTVYDLYATIFSSTKQDTNEQVGAFGLGSKSPFAYTDGFTVTCYTGSEAHSFAAFIDERGCPIISKTGVDEGCAEPRGVEISFPVKSEDIQRFVQAAKKAYVGFALPPIVKGAENFNADEIFKPLGKGGQGWQMFKGDYSTVFRGVIARQGCVCYPVDVYQCQNATGGKPAFSGSVLIDFPIGSLDIVPSREGLEYTKKTAATVFARLEEISAEVQADLEAQIATAPTYWAAVRRYHEDLLPSYGANSGWEPPKYRGKELRVTLNVKEISNTGEAATPRKLRQMQGKKRAFQESGVSIGSSAIYVQDLSREKREPRIYDRIADHYSSLGKKDRANVAFFRVRNMGFAFKRMLVALGRPADVYFIHDLPDNHIPSSRGYTKTRVKAWIANAHGRFDETEFALDPEGDTPTYFIRRERGIVEPTFPTNEYAYANAFNAMKKHGFIETDAVLYMVPKTYWKRLKKTDWVHFAPIFRDFYKDCGVTQINEAKALLAYDDGHGATLIKRDARRYDDVVGDVLAIANCFQTLSPDDCKSEYRQAVVASRDIIDAARNARKTVSANVLKRVKVSNACAQVTMPSGADVENSTLATAVTTFYRHVKGLRGSNNLVGVMLKHVPSDEFSNYKTDFVRLLKNCEG